MEYFTEKIQKRDSKEEFVIVSAAEIAEPERTRALELLQENSEAHIWRDKSMNLVFLDAGLKRTDVCMEVAGRVGSDPLTDQVTEQVARIRKNTPGAP